mgnify:CR=1 FL=1
MDAVLRMLLQKMFYTTANLKEIKTVDDLCAIAICMEDVVKIFAAMNDDNDGYSTAEILKIANEVYQEGKNND